MRFLADMGISRRTVEWLRRCGHEATHLLEEGLERLSDPDILDKARSENRILLTMDLDFGYLLAVSKWKLPNVIIFRLSDERSEIVNTRLMRTLTRFSDAIEAGAVISVGNRTIRARSLPIKQHN